MSLNILIQILKLLLNIFSNGNTDRQSAGCRVQGAGCRQSWQECSFSVVRHGSEDNPVLDRTTQALPPRFGTGECPGHFCRHHQCIVNMHGNSNKFIASEVCKQIEMSHSSSRVHLN